MSKLNTIQKVLIATAFIVFIFATIISIIFVLPSIKNETIRNLITARPIVVKTSKDSQTLEQKYAYGDNIVISSGMSEIDFNNNRLASASLVNLTVNNKDDVVSLQIQQGIIYIEANSDLPVNLGTNQIKINSGVKAIYNSENGSLIIIAGKQQVKDGKTAGPNEIITWQIDNFTSSSFDRSILSSNNKYKELIAALNKFNMTPEELKLLSPPEITEITPASQITTKEDSITLTGKVNAGVTLTLDDKSVSIDSEGKFSTKLNLNPGINSFQLTATDKFGNKKVVLLTYTREDSNPCAQGSTTNQLLCLVNKYRTDRQLLELKLDSSLTDVASKHAVWMAANNSTSHIETDGNSFGDRCVAANIECKSEINLQITDTESAQDIFTNIINSDEYVKYIKVIDYSKLGISFSGNYVSILLD